MSNIDTDPSYTDQDEKLRELLEREHQILEMQNTPGWDFWRDYVARLAVPYQNKLLRGSHKDLMEYRYDAGVVEGLRMALAVTDRLHNEVSGMREILELDQLANEGEPDVIA